ncbi:rad2 superfamily protein mus201 [Calliopsis andreniformis]|uniref:rad2 superfamily protein mus201 n=1 Tax=Calliopsis andreniformis TaxID=337506 RepID=UPI003FCEBC62
MGVYGLWRLLDATGKQVPLETLEGKILAVDVSIWIHQVLQGYQDRFGNPKPNAHLIGLYSRICKLLYYKIKPVFVFDGGVPLLKKDTITLRRKQKSMAKNKAQQMRTDLINNLIKHSAVKTVLNSENQNATNDSSEIAIKLPSKRTIDDIFKLPNMPSTSKAELNVSDDYDSDSSIELSPRKQTKWIGNIHHVDVTSAEFRALPADMRYEILTDLKETRKQNSWGRLHEMPEESHEFSGFQMKRLLKRRLVQQSLESAEKEMGGKALTLDELEKLLTEQGITTNDRNCAYRIAADNTTRLIYISDKNAFNKNTTTNNNDKSINENNMSVTKEPIKPVAISCSDTVSIREDINEYELDDEWDSEIDSTTISSSKLRMDVNSDSVSEEELNESRSLAKKYFNKNNMNPALTYMLEYSGLTEGQILTLLEQDKARKLKQSDCIDPQNSKKKDNELNSSTSISEDNKEFTKIDSTKTTESLQMQQTELLESSSKSNNDLLLSATLNMPNEEKIKAIETIAISSADSDSDDFIEIKDATNTNVNTNTSQQSILISFKTDQKMEDDMFADVFTESNNEFRVDTESQNILLSNEGPKKLIKNPLNHEKTEEEEVIPEEVLVESGKKVFVESRTEERKDKQLFDITKLDNAEVQITKNDININSKDIQEVMDEEQETNCIEIISDCRKSTVESSHIKDNTSENIPSNEDELLSLKAKLEDEQTELMTNIGKLERQGINISEQIRVEAQELLRLFGIPYVIAPMEAEAQCAYLEQIRLTDGTITDDSDIWLFGGQCVYKNFFDNNKKVLEFRSCDIQHHYKLTRSELIRLALLVGSDYTVGVSGIGPVTALEILAAFPSEGDDLLQGLEKFYSWVETGKAPGPGRTTLRNKLQNVEIHKGFPSQAVAQAYLFPKVDESKEGFTWSKPNTILLLNYTKQKFGWNQMKFDEIMTPLMKRLEEKQKQKSIDTYFKVQTVPKSIEMSLSTRVRKAVQRLSNQNIEDSGSVESTQRQESKKRISKSRSKKHSEKNELTSEINVVLNSVKSKIIPTSTAGEQSLEERIPQREKDKADALKKKLHAIEILRKSKQGLYKTKKVKRCVRKVKVEAGLSESDSSSS